MIDTVPRPNASLPELLAQRARHASDGRLAADVAGGLIVGAVVVILTPPGWIPLLSAALCFAAFGAWGITDRALIERAGVTSRATRLLRAGRGVAAIVGACAGAMLLLSVFALALGTWIS